MPILHLNKIAYKMCYYDNYKSNGKHEMKYLLLLLLSLLTLQAQNFSKKDLLGTWELSSAKLNKSVAFINYIGKERNEVLELLFNPQGQMKIVKTGEVYNYEVVQGQLKIYETNVYKNNYIVKRKNRYDLFKIIGSVESCNLVKLMKKRYQAIILKEI